jgi:hypothetical protein
MTVGIAIGILLYSIVYDYVKERELAQVRLEDSTVDSWLQVMEPAPVYQCPATDEKRSQAVLAASEMSET